MAGTDNGRPERAAPEREPAQAALGFVTRFMMLVAVGSTLVTSLALLVFGAVETVHLVRDMFRHEVELSRDDVMLRAIELVDVFLVATVVQVVSIGLYQLYINDRIPLPQWLRIRDIDDLKAKLTGVVITVLGVFFLGAAISWEDGSYLLPLGLSVAAVIVALSFFLLTHNRHIADRDRHKPD